MYSIQVWLGFFYYFFSFAFAVVCRLSTFASCRRDFHILIFSSFWFLDIFNLFPPRRLFVWPKMNETTAHIFGTRSDPTSIFNRFPRRTLFCLFDDGLYYYVDMHMLVCCTYRAKQIEDEKNIFHHRHSTPHFRYTGFELVVVQIRTNWIFCLFLFCFVWHRERALECRSRSSTCLLSECKTNTEHWRALSNTIQWLAMAVAPRF